MCLCLHLCRMKTVISIVKNTVSTRNINGFVTFLTNEEMLHSAIHNMYSLAVHINMFSFFCL